MNGLIALDVGTTSLRAVLYDVCGRALHVERRFCEPRYHEGGRVEEDPATWSAGVTDALAGCAAQAARTGVRLHCVSATAQRSSVIAVDAGGAPLHPALMWQDTRAASLASAMAAELPRVYRRTGLRISPVFSAVKMTWLRRHRPEVWGATARLLGVQDWVVHLLTGRYVTDHTFGSRTNLMDLAARDWDDELLELFEVPRHLLCELVAPGSVVGGIEPEFAARTGLASGLPVVSAGGDQQCAALGLGLFDAGCAVANTGTGSYLIGHSARPALDDAMRVSCNVSALPGAYIVEAAMLSTGAVRQWFDALADRDGVDPPERDDEIAAVPPGADGLVVLPHFEGSGSPHWDPRARGAIVGLGLDTTRAQLRRAILEAIATELAQGLEIVESLCGRAEQVHVSGGLTRSALFNRIQSDALERPVLRFEEGEATAHGAWIAGCVATGLADGHAQAFARIAQRAPPARYDPDPASASVYRGLRRRARAIYSALAAPAARADGGQGER